MAAACLLRASFRPHLTVRPLRFAVASPPSGCEEDFHLQAIDPARHTQKGAAAGRGASAKPNLETSPGYLAFLVAFLSAFLAFFAMENLLPSFNRLLLGQAKRTNRSVAHCHSYTGARRQCQEDFATEQKNCARVCSWAAARTVCRGCARHSLFGRFGECPTVVPLPRQNRQPVSADPYLDRVVVHRPLALGRIRQRVLVPRFFRDPRVKL
jgi:hypothetical protein